MMPSTTLNGCLNRPVKNIACLPKASGNTLRGQVNDLPTGGDMMKNLIVPIVLAVEQGSTRVNRQKLVASVLTVSVYTTAVVMFQSGYATAGTTTTTVHQVVMKFGKVETAPIVSFVVAHTAHLHNLYAMLNGTNSSPMNPMTILVSESSGKWINSNLQSIK